MRTQQWLPAHGPERAQLCPSSWTLSFETFPWQWMEALEAGAPARGRWAQAGQVQPRASQPLGCGSAFCARRAGRRCTAVWDRREPTHFPARQPRGPAPKADGRGHARAEARAVLGALGAWGDSRRGSQPSSRWTPSRPGQGERLGVTGVTCTPKSHRRKMELGVEPCTQPVHPQKGFREFPKDNSRLMAAGSGTEILGFVFIHAPLHCVMC
ncbi:uncharacterized protein LOC101721384 [Heterocephalus glaber]|uniref:Uncharacterized protein LOC101721384 n=1 Tax=Heterocephalus glaber TaxID=10181 RepID=A0AAX6QIU0_HETGA|nr:uncharacterized protein LOC101721384 [Heterocephalus glaber]